MMVEVIPMDVVDKVWCEGIVVDENVVARAHEDIGFDKVHDNHVHWIGARHRVGYIRNRVEEVDSMRIAHENTTPPSSDYPSYSANHHQNDHFLQHSNHQKPRNH